MKITVTEEMREALEKRGEAMRDGDRTRIGFFDRSLARLVAQAVEVEEAKERICFEEPCTRERTSGIYCAAHAAEHEEVRRQALADRKAGKPCGACVFIGGTCWTCLDAQKAEKEAGDA